ncbi:MAG: YceH family protein [Acidimicrobiales bacterium]
MEVLSPEQLRVLGALIEKEATTPDQYPLTMNALLLACNQSSNRNPIVSWSAADVEPVVASLRALGLARVVHSPSNRADKYRHVVHEAWGLTSGELAVLAILALRGPQTVNDLRSRTERYTGLEDLGGVDGVLHRLKNRYDEPYVTRLERQPGQREERWAHLLAGEVLDVPAPTPSAGRGSGSAERVAALEAEVAALSGEVAALRKDLDELRDMLA